MQKSFKIILLIILAVAIAIALSFAYKKPVQAPTVNTTIPLPKTTTIFFGGDIMLSRNVHHQMEQAQNFTLPFKQIADEIRKIDIAFANLESPFNDKGAHYIDQSLVFNADPRSVEGLKLAGFDILSTANNHAFDQGQKGIDYTIDWLSSNNIIYTGTKHSVTEQVLPVIKHDNILYGFLSYSYTALNDGGKTTSPYVNDFNDLIKLKQDILDMRGHLADVVIVSMHAGTEYTRQPTQKQMDFAHAAIDAGADLVIGHHPHWIQTVEQYQGKWIFYSLGNLVFDQMWSQDTKEGLTLFVTYDKEQIKKIELKPVIIEDFCCPRWANPDESLAILNKIGLTNPILFGQN